MALITGYPLFRAFGDDGSPLVGGLLNTYVAGTTTPKITYSDAAETTPNANPVVLDSRGEALVYLLQDEAYKFVLTDADGAAIVTVDNVGASLLTSTFGVEHNIATGVHEFPGTSAAGDTFYQGASSVVRLALGTAGHVLTAGASAPAWAVVPKMALVALSRDVSVTGDQAITGAGFTPKAIIIVAVVHATSVLSVGFSDGTSNRSSYQIYSGNTGNSTSKAVTTNTVSGSYAEAAVSAVGTDGCTLTWTKTGSPTGTAVGWIAFIG